ncbi:MAG: EamA family transporter [Chloroflexi bacterium]|nr:EamA family transporter [Chloroflexota bacterium]
MWVALALGAALLTSFNPILYKRILQDAEPLVVVWGVTLLALPLLGLFTLALTSEYPRIDGLFVLSVSGAAGLNVMAHLASTKALKLADVSLVTPLLTFSPVFTLLISAVLFGETPSARGLLGVGLVLVGAYWLNLSSADRLAPLKAFALKPGIMLILLAGLLWAVTPLLEKTAIRHTSPESPRFAAFVATALLAIMLTPGVVARGRAAISKLFLHRREWWLAALIAGSAPILGYTAFSLGFVGYVTTLFKLSTILTVLWGSLFLKERNLAQRLPGSLMMVVGAVLIVM